MQNVIWLGLQALSFSFTRSVSGRALNIPQGRCCTPQESQHSIRAFNLAQSAVEKADRCFGCQISAIDQIREQLAKSPIGDVLLRLKEVWHHKVVP